MGKRGPSKKPTALKILHGTHRADRHGAIEDEPAPAEADISIVPDDLGEHGRKVWQTVGPQLKSLGLLTLLDLPPFTTYCQAHDEIAACQASLLKDGHYFTRENGSIGRHPASVDIQAWLTVKRNFERDFGMTASSRSGLKVQPKQVSTVAKRTRA